MHNITQLHHFNLVVQAGSFARAADLAGITQPALSNSIRSLERKLGFALFERSERPVAPTPEAKDILPRVEAVLFEVRNLDQAVANLVSGESGHIRLGMTAVYSTSTGGPIIAEWHNANPQVKLDLVIEETVDLLRGLRDELFDVIIGDVRDLQTDIDDLALIELPAQRSGAFCRAGHPILDIRIPRLADLARYHFAGTHFPADVFRAFVRLVQQDCPELEPSITIDSHNIAALRDAVAESDLILLTTPGTVRNALALGILKHIPIDLGIDGRWAIVTRRGRVHHPAVPRLIDKIVEVGKREHDRRLAPYARQYARPLKD